MLPSAKSYDTGLRNAARWRSAANAASYLRLAETYDAMAEQANQLARDIVKSGIKR
jgi:hypothetical protein